MSVFRNNPPSTVTLGILMLLSAGSFVLAMLPSEVGMPDLPDIPAPDLKPIEFPQQRTVTFEAFAYVPEASIFNAGHAKDQPPPPPAPPKPPPPTPLETFRLAGIVMSPSNQVALVQDRRSGLIRSLHKGEMFEGWTIDAIGSGIVSVVGNDGQTGRIGIPRAAGHITMGGVSSDISKTPTIVR